MSEVVFGKEFFEALKKLIDDIKKAVDKYKWVGLGFVILLALLVLIQQIILIFFLSG